MNPVDPDYQIIRFELPIEDFGILQQLRHKEKLTQRDLIVKLLRKEWKKHEDIPIGIKI